MKHTVHSTQYTTNNMNGGFTFIETVVAIAVLIVSVVAPLSLAAQGLRTARIARDQVIANYLAQEAVEFLRFQRDNNALEGNDWLFGFTDCLSGSCTVDIPNNTIKPCSGSCPVLQFDDAVGTYEYDDELPDTKFTRTVSITYGEDPEREISAVVSVSWNDVLVSRTYTLYEKLFNWQ